MTVRVGRSLIALSVMLSVTLACGADDVRRAERYGDWLAKMAAFEGSVDAQRAGKPRLWDAAVLNDSYFEGDRVRTGERSRAQLQLRQENFLTLDQNSVALLGAPSDKLPSWLQLILGKLRFRSRQPSTLGIQTPFVNAIHRGTEFQVEVRDQETLITVFDGEVEAKNEHGVLSIAKGQSAIARKGEAPRLYTVVKPEDALQWSLYYPPVLDFGSVPAGESSELQRALNQYRRNDINGALVVLDSIPAESRTPRILNLRAGLLLTVGRLDEARPDIDEALRRNPKDATALAQQAVVAVAQNRKDEALRLAEQAVAADPKSSSAKLALSYALQARFQLPEARDAIRSAHRDDPNNALVLARLAELELSLGDMDKGEEAATEALRINPRQGRAKSLLGFAQLMQMDTDEAIATFNQAVTDDPSDPLGRFGLGLAKIRKGDLEAGTVEMETAASLSPDDPLIRSYLGKAYYEQKRSEPAATEYQIAKELDPKDPTPYFYDAIKKQTENRPVEALRDLQKAIELNGNRHVYRSKQEMDEDLAARSAGLGRIFRDLGFEKRGLFEGWQSVAADPGDYSGHRLLADTYSALPGHELARVSELLQAQLLQPFNSTPIQPQLAEANILLLDRSGPADLSFNEFNPLFLRNGFNWQLSGLAGNNGSYGNEITHAGVLNNFSYSLGQFHYQTDGFRKNNDLDLNIYSLFSQYRISPDLSLQAEYRHRETKQGDLTLRFDQDQGSDTDRRQLDYDTARIGAVLNTTDHSKLLTSLQYIKREVNFNQYPIVAKDTIRREGYLLESQYIYKLNSLNIILGAGRSDASVKDKITYDFSSVSSDCADTSSCIYTENDIRKDIRSNGYLYANFKPFEKALMTLGVSYDSLKTGAYVRRRLNPKFGLQVKLTPETQLRLAAFQSLKFPRGIDQTIEPTQIAGFNQFFDDTEAMRARRYGIGLDSKFSENTYGGVEASIRDLEAVIFDGNGSGIGKKHNRIEQSFRSYLYISLSNSLSLTSEFQFESFRRKREEDSSNPLRVDSTMIPISVRYFHPNGFFIKLGASYVLQEITSASDSQSKTEDFFVVDASLGFRLPKRLGIISLEGRNLLDQRFRFQDPILLENTERSPRLIPDQAVFLRATLNFN